MEPNRFRFILDQVPQWWKDLAGTRIEVGVYPIALLPSGEAVIAGDWIIRNDDGSVHTESHEQGRIEARATLTKEWQEISNGTNNN